MTHNHYFLGNFNGDGPVAGIHDEGRRHETLLARHGHQLRVQRWAEHGRVTTNMKQENDLFSLLIKHFFNKIRNCQVRDFHNSSIWKPTPPFD